MAPFQNKINIQGSTCALSNGYLSGIIEASIFFLVKASTEVEKRSFQVN